MRVLLCPLYHHTPVCFQIQLPYEIKVVKLKPSLLIKFKFIEEQANNGNILAKQYLDKLRKDEVSIDWAHSVLVTGICQQRMLKMMAIADNKHFSYQSENDLLEFIASGMQKEGLDPNNEEKLDSYLNTKPCYPRHNTRIG